MPNTLALFTRATVKHLYSSTVAASGQQP